MFMGGEEDILSIAAHNIHENVVIFQEGGTSMLIYGQLLDQYNF